MFRRRNGLEQVLHARARMQRLEEKRAADLERNQDSARMEEYNNALILIIENGTKLLYRRLNEQGWPDAHQIQINSRKSIFPKLIYATEFNWAFNYLGEESTFWIWLATDCKLYSSFNQDRLVQQDPHSMTTLELERIHKLFVREFRDELCQEILRMSSARNRLPD